MKRTNRTQSDAVKQRTAPRVPRTLELEHLESRTLLAGNVTASIDANGILQISGDSEGNCVIIQSTSNFSVTGCQYDPVSKTVGFPGGTTVNGLVSANFPSSAIKGLTANLWGGNDYFGSAAAGAKVSGPVSINVGCISICFASDDDYVQLGQYTHFKAGLKVRTGIGNDLIRIHGGAKVDGKTELYTGSGHDEVLSPTNAQFNGDLLIDTGTGNDTVSLRLTSVGGTTQIKTGDGSDAVGIHDAVFEQGFEVLLGKSEGFLAWDMLQVDYSVFKGAFYADGQDDTDFFDEGPENTYYGTKTLKGFEYFQDLEYI